MKSLVPILALLIIAGAAIFTFTYFRSQPTPGQTVAHKAPVACEACGKAYITMLSDQPATCYNCQQQTVWRARQCSQCKTIVPIVGGPSHGSGSAPPCPKCGPTRLTEVPADELEEH